jgi:5'(3')-deoxyribonucleotidase
MKLLLENWRKYLKEYNENFPYQIYCDMDGVLVDFDKAAVDKINEDLKDETITGESIDKLRLRLSDLGRGPEITKEDLYKESPTVLDEARGYMKYAIADNEHFWANLPWMPDGEELWNYISKFGASILTTAMGPEDGGSKRGKLIWIKNNLEPKPAKVFVSGGKYRWAISEDGSASVLIDDFQTNTGPWNKTQEAQGLPQLAILHTSTAETIQQLEKLDGKEVHSETTP